MITNAFLIAAAAGVGFGRAPWAAFAISASLIILLGLPQHLDLLKRYAGHPRTDIYFIIVIEVGVAIAGAFASAWTGYALLLLLRG
jgi:hypothetical protein